MDKNKSIETVKIVKFFTSKYFYMPLYVKGAEEAVFLLGTKTQDYHLIIITNESMINHMTRKTLLKKINLVVNKLDDKPQKILILSFSSKVYETKENNIDIYHIFSDYIPNKINQLYPKFQDLDIFDDYYDKQIEKEKEEKEIDSKLNRIEDKTTLSSFIKSRKKTFSKSNVNTKKPQDIAKTLILQNSLTKGILIFVLVAAFIFQFLLSVPVGSETATKTIAFGGLYGPFVYGYKGIWRLFTFPFISTNLMTFIFVAIFFYFFSRMTESFYGAIRYVIIFIVGNVLVGLVSSQLFPEIVYGGLGLTLWLFIGSTTTFVIVKWRNIAKTIKAKFIIYSIIVLFFSLLIGFGTNIEAGFIAILIGVVLGMAVQFKITNFKLEWKKSINPIIATTLLLITAITIPLASNRKVPLKNSIVNQSVFVTYEKYKLISSPAKEEFISMYKNYYEIQKNKSACLWNLNVANQTSETLSNDLSSSLISSTTNLNDAFIASDEKVIAAITREMNTLINQIDTTNYSAINTKAITWKESYITYANDYSKSAFNTVNTQYNDLIKDLDLEILTPQIAINKARVNEIFNNILKWDKIIETKRTLKLSKAIAFFKDKPRSDNQRAVRKEVTKLKGVINKNLFKVDFTSFKTTLDNELNNQRPWCFDLDL